jgi:hypothetical protein
MGTGIFREGSDASPGKQDCFLGDVTQDSRSPKANAYVVKTGSARISCRWPPATGWTVLWTFDFIQPTSVNRPLSRGCLSESKSPRAGTKP